MLPSRHVEASWETKSVHLKLVMIVSAPAMCEVDIHIHLPGMGCTYTYDQNHHKETDVHDGKVVA